MFQTLVQAIGNRGALWCLRVMAVLLAVVLVSSALLAMSRLSPWADAVVALFVVIAFAWRFERGDQA